MAKHGDRASRNPTGQAAAASRTDVHTPEEDIALARTLLRKGEFEHALRHLADAIACDAGRIEWREVLDDWIVRVGDDPLRFFPRSGEIHVSQLAVQAYVVAEKGDSLAALRLLSRVVTANRNTTYIESWALGWLNSDEVLRAVEPKLVQTLLLPLVMNYPELLELRKVERDCLKRALQLLDRHAVHHQEDIETQIIRAAFLRKLGRYDDAYKVARQAHAQQPTYLTANALANIYRETGHLEKAVAANREAIRHRPDDVAARLDLGDLYLEQARWKESLKWYEEVLQKQPQHAWALPSAYYCRLQLTQDDVWKSRLAKLTENGTKDDRSHYLYEKTIPYAGYLPEPEDALAHLLRALTAEGRKAIEAYAGKVYPVKVSSLEAPSIRLAFAKHVEALGISCELEINTEKVPVPDPRQPMSRVRHLLWKYDGQVPRPALSAPSAEIARAVARLARQPYVPTRNWRMASVVAEAAGTKRAREILAVMVHPPAIEGGVSALVWVPRVQLTVAQILAQLDSGWSGSLRREILFDIARGPMDWTTNAAILALTQLGQQDASIAADIHGLFYEILQHVPRGGFCCYLETLLVNWLMLPGVPDAERQQIGELLQQLWQQK